MNGRSLQPILLLAAAAACLALAGRLNVALLAMRERHHLTAAPSVKSPKRKTGARTR